MKKPIVSVIMITYGHEKYIAQAIDGVLMQEGNVDLELIIANDCSPDDTDAEVRKFIDTHPKGKLIKYTKHEKNKGMMPNFLWALKQASGKYIALCEGDDYWTDPLKLQKQVDFLENNSLINLSATNAQIFEERLNTFRDFNIPEKYLGNIGILDWNYIFSHKGVVLPTASFVFRKTILDDSFYSLLNRSSVGDYIIILRSIETGFIHIFKQQTAVYRITHNTNSWTSQINEKKITNFFNERLEFWEFVEKNYLCFKDYISKAKSNQITSYINSLSQYVSKKAQLKILYKNRKKINLNDYWYLIPRIFLK